MPVNKLELINSDWHSNCEYGYWMNIGLTISNGRMAPCFPGADVWVLDSEGDMKQKQIVDTGNWKPLTWARELMHLNVSVLLCCGIDRFLWGSLQGHGIEVVPNAVGLPDEIIMRWQSGRLTVPETWPLQIQNACGTGRRKRQGRKRLR